ncbi:Vegetative incompatibility HET-E-1 [Fusarium albosuccineum]|uniref:Vegetative incompatibility HET-E-1 n=1 Tax=Fusarium albosuccineum TaxID=1237068 RepID=A0A8H4L384_9HYPO|nr:Vegetative incompatibility HET-E-1 [Fusarium albosuccineum]
MRLINAETLQLHEFHGENIPPYAILSHTWGDEEVTFQDWQDHAAAAAKAGFTKIQGACSQTLQEDLKWVWVDTNCIDKTSSAELTEAINSMFAYYQRSVICFAYLSDVPTASSIDREALLWQVRQSRWFTRGWTLQELLAPEELVFYASDWSFIGWRNHPGFSTLISQITNFDREYLTGDETLRRMHLKKNVLAVNEKDDTNRRHGILRAWLQEEIIKTTNDHTIFCWTWTHSVPKDWTSFLAPSPSQFEGAGDMRSYESDLVGEEFSIFSITNAGLSIKLPVMYALNSYFVVLQAGPAGGAEDEDEDEFSHYACIHVQGEERGNVLYVSREPYPLRPCYIPRAVRGHLQSRPFLVMKKLSEPRSDVSVSLASTSDSHEAILRPVFQSESLRSQFVYHHMLQQGATSPADATRGFVIKAEAKTLDTFIGVGIIEASLSKHTGASENVYIFAGIKLHERKRHLVFDLFPKQDIGISYSHRYYDFIQNLEERELRAEWSSQIYYYSRVGLWMVIEDSRDNLGLGDYISFVFLAR